MRMDTHTHTHTHTHTQVLQLENNRLEVLPETLGDLPNLVKLDLSTNSLRFLPASLVRVYTIIHT